MNDFNVDTIASMTAMKWMEGDGATSLSADIKINEEESKVVC